MNAVKVNFPTLSYLAVTFKFFFLVTHRFPGHTSNGADKDFLPPQEDLVYAVCFGKSHLNVC